MGMSVQQQSVPCPSHNLAPALFRVFSECDWEYLHVVYMGLESHDVSTKENNKELKSFKGEENGNFRTFRTLTKCSRTSLC